MKSLIALSLLVIGSTAASADVDPIRLPPLRPQTPAVAPVPDAKHATTPAATHAPAVKKKHLKKHAKKLPKAP
ncbi:MAG: hypothetical protein ABIV50_00595 [Opitutus sp.]